MLQLDHRSVCVSKKNTRTDVSLSDVVLRTCVKMIAMNTKFTVCLRPMCTLFCLMENKQKDRKLKRHKDKVNGWIVRLVG